MGALLFFAAFAITIIASVEVGGCMKTTVIGIVGGLLLVVAGAAGGYYVGKSTNPVSRVKVEETLNSDRDKLTHNLIEVRADMAEIGTSIDPLADLKQIARKFRAASATYLYFLETRRLPQSLTRLSERQCLQDSEEAIEEAKTASMMWEHCAKLDDCSKNEFNAYTTVAAAKNDEVEGVLERCLAIFSVSTGATASADN
jgi:hypothetical protein